MAYDNLRELVQKVRDAHARQDVLGYLDHLSKSLSLAALEEFEQLLDSFSQTATYIGDPDTDGSWRFSMEDDNDLKVEQLVSGSWVTRARFADDHFYAVTPCPYMYDPEA